jgi:hypothetical protein
MKTSVAPFDMLKALENNFGSRKIPSIVMKMKRPKPRMPRSQISFLCYPASLKLPKINSPLKNDSRLKVHEGRCSGTKLTTGVGVRRHT